MEIDNGRTVLRVSNCEVVDAFGSVAEFIGLFAAGAVGVGCAGGCGVVCECAAGGRLGAFRRVGGCSAGGSGAGASGARDYVGHVRVSTCAGSSGGTLGGGSGVGQRGENCEGGSGNAPESVIDSAASGSLAGGSGVAGDQVRGKNYKRNQRKRASCKQRGASVKDEIVAPEWRRKDGGGTYHRGVFSECAPSVQLALRESRARMLVARNETAIVDAEHRRRFVEARLKSRSVEEEVERARLESDKKLRGLRAEVAPAQGYAETVISALGTPSLSDGSVSPDSSISVAEVKKKDEAIQFLLSELELVKLNSEKKVNLLVQQKLDLEKEKEKMADAAAAFESKVKAEQEGACRASGGSKKKKEKPQENEAPGSREKRVFDKEFERVVNGLSGDGSDGEETELTYEEMEEEAQRFFSTGSLR